MRIALDQLVEVIPAMELTEQVGFYGWFFRGSRSLRVRREV